MDDQKRIMLWAVPRSLSSAMCRVMLNSGVPTQVLFEPFSGAYYFGPERISPRYGAREPDPSLTYASVKDQLEQPYEDKKLVFVKDHAYSLSGRIEERWIPDGYTHTFLIRHPRAAITSFLNVVNKGDIPEWDYFDPAEAGFREQLELCRLLQKLGHKIVVLDADDLIDKPEAALQAYCQEVGLEFSQKMLDWNPMSDSEFSEIFGAWEPAWFGRLRDSKTISRGKDPHKGRETNHVSNGVRTPEDTVRDGEVESFVEECLPCYEELRKFCLCMN